MNLDKNLENKITKFINNINKKKENKLSKKERKNLMNTLHPFRFNIISVIIYFFGFVLFIFLWNFLKADRYMTENTYWVKYFIYILFMIITLLNIFLSTEKPANYEVELEIQRSVETNAFYVSAGSLALALFVAGIRKLDLISSKDKNLVRLPFLFLCVSFICGYLILLFINLPKIGILVHYYRNIISQLLNLSIIYIISSITLIIALLKN